jgi:hypothetical protein
MGEESFKSKVIFSIIDKVIIGFVAALLIFLFQQNQMKSAQAQQRIIEKSAQARQRLIEASQSVSTIYTSILLKQRADIIDTMSKYFLLVEKIKEECIPIDPKQTDELNGFLYTMRFNIKSIQDMTPPQKEATSKEDNSTKKEIIIKDLSEVSRKFEQSITLLNSLIIDSSRKKECPSNKEIQTNINNIMFTYQQFLGKVRDLTITTIQDEIKVGLAS